ncbi:WhiB family transcriptional regulator [Streptomyces chartreusis]|uniref:WhiB family transcriptional regulator n=1 Tax=Streptomyces chartreusis TaxID=1969 RepID=UPI00368D424D
MGSDWFHEAKCGVEDPGIFFPPYGSRDSSRHVEIAKSLCAHCPVASHCLDWAMTTRQETGIWGGLTPYERKGLRRRRAIVPPSQPNRGSR